MKDRSNSLISTILVLNAIALVGVIILSNINVSLKKKIDSYESETEKPVTQDLLERLKVDTRKLEGKLMGLVDMFDTISSEDKTVFDGAIVFARKLDGIEKKLLLKTEIKGLLPPQIEVPKVLPSKEDAPYFIRNMEVLEKAVDLGLKAGLDFTFVEIPTPTQQDNKSLAIELRFRAEALNVAQYVLLLTEFLPLLSIEKMELSRQESFTYNMKVTKLMVDSRVLSSISDAAMPKDYRNYVIVSGDLKEKFLQNKIFKKMQTHQVISAKTPQDAPKIATQRFFYRGMGSLKGEAVAAVEDTVKNKVFFLSLGEKIEDFEVKGFQENRLILKNIKNQKELILKREVD
ncbi:MAG: hypothetical protein JW734_01685 [Candidatus Omnitrophica bacterium]|nr:hypothetical protein [Candidatus Omnitrophota bacterium]